MCFNILGIPSRQLAAPPQRHKGAHSPSRRRHTGPVQLRDKDDIEEGGNDDELGETCQTGETLIRQGGRTFLTTTETR